MIRFLSVEEVIYIHDVLIAQHGGLMGLRDLGLLISAIETPKIQIDKKFLHKSIFDQAAAYLFHISKNYPFLDGNKRTAAASALIFLKDNFIDIEFDSMEFEQLVLNAARGQTSKRSISLFLKKAML